MSDIDRTDRGAYMALGLVFGAAAGMAAGLLVAPQSGRETRFKLRRRAEIAKNQTKQQMAAKRDQLSKKMSNSIEKGKRAVSRAADTAQDTVEQ